MHIQATVTISTIRHLDWWVLSSHAQEATLPPKNSGRKINLLLEGGVTPAHLMRRTKSVTRRIIRWSADRLYLRMRLHIQMWCHQSALNGDLTWRGVSLWYPLREHWSLLGVFATCWSDIWLVVHSFSPSFGTSEKECFWHDVSCEPCTSYQRHLC